VSAGIWQNWGRSVRVRPQSVARPVSVDEVVQVVRDAAARGVTVKAVGSGHSFTGIAVATGIQLDLSGLTGLVRLDRATARATFAAGTILHDAGQLLEANGLGFENLGDIDSQTISGAISTGTHGTGVRFGGLATRVVGLTMVTADAGVLRIGDTGTGPVENADLLPAAAIGLGALGVIVDVTVQCVPAFLVHSVERTERLDAVLADFGARAAAADHFEFFWFPHTEVVLTKTNTRLSDTGVRRPLSPARAWFDDRFVANSMFALTCGLARLVPALTPAINRLATQLTGDREFTEWSRGVFATPRTVRFRELEYAIPLEAVPQALGDIRRLIEERGWMISFPVEVRTTAADDLWLSPAHDRASGYIAVHRHFRDDPREYFRAVEQILLSHGGRPHWGKLHFQGATSLAGAYPRHADFVALRDRLDPDRLFSNAYLEKVLGP
jgi:FAD-linked oxidoreductase